MAIDEELKVAIKKSASESGQPESMHNRLIAWLDALSDRDLSVQEQDEHLDSVLSSIQLKEDADEN